MDGSVISPTNQSEAARQYVAASVDDCLFAIPILQAQDILAPRTIAPVPLAPDWVAGVMNLRGRIVTAIDFRRRLCLEPADTSASPCIVFNHDGEQYGLLVDQIRDILEVPVDRHEPNPPTMDQAWSQFSRGICRLDDELMIIIDVDDLLESGDGRQTG